MKTNFTTTLLSSILMLCVTGNATVADDLNPAPYRGWPASVFAEFDFNDNGMNPSPPTNFDWVEGPNGEPLHQLQPCIEFGSFFNWKNGTWINAPIKPELFKIKMPNIEDDFEVKLIRLQITWIFDGKSDPPMIINLTGADAEDGPLTEVTFLGGSTMIMGSMRHTTYNILVRPNPDWEMIDVAARPGMGIKQVVVDTISIPGFVPGDVNGDGKVNLLDVGPFIDLLSSGGYLPAADLNDDGEVNLLDVSLFIELLSS